MEFTSEDDYKVIKKENKKMSSDEQSLSSMPEELFENYKAPSANVNLTDRYNNLWIELFQIPLPFRFTARNAVTIRNVLLDLLMRLLQGIEKPIVTPDSHMPWSNKELAAVIRNATENVDYQLHTIHINSQQNRRHYRTDCYDYYCESHGSSQQMTGRDIGLDYTIYSICGHKGHRYLS